MPLDSHPLSDLWESSPSSTKGVGFINILLMALLASLSPGWPAEMSSALLFSLIHSVWERGGEGWVIERERDLDSMRARDRENEGDLFKGRDPVARAPNWLPIDRLTWVESGDGLELPCRTALCCAVNPSPMASPLIIIKTSCKLHLNFPYHCSATYPLRRLFPLAHLRQP